MPNKITYTGKVGPAGALTSLVMDFVRQVCIDYDKQTITVTWGEVNPVTQTFSLAGTTGFTYTIASAVATITIT